MLADALLAEKSDSTLVLAGPESVFERGADGIGVKLYDPALWCRERRVPFLRLAEEVLDHLVGCDERRAAVLADLPYEKLDIAQDDAVAIFVHDVAINRVTGIEVGNPVERKTLDDDCRLRCEWMRSLSRCLACLICSVGSGARD